MMKEIYTLRIELARGMSPNHWSRSVEIPADMSLDGLHLCIQNVIDFDNDPCTSSTLPKSQLGSTRV